MRWSITVNLAEEEQKAVKILCIDLNVGIGAWVAELMRMDLEAHKEVINEKAKVVVVRIKSSELLEKQT